MRKPIVVMLALAIAALANSAYAEFQWKHPGADPYATSREVAMQTRESAFRKLGFPGPVVELLMEATKVSGAKSKMVMGSRLNTMLSKGGVIHKDVVLAWEAPIRGTELVAPNEMWEVKHEGMVYKAFLFDVCNNWSGIIASAPAPAPPPTPQAVPQAPPAVPTFATGACPSGYTLFANAWSMKTLPSGKLLPGMREEAESLIKAANERDSQEAMKLSAYQPDAFSRTLGKRLREEVKVHAPVSVDLQVRYLDPQTAKVVRELGTMRMERGVGSFRFSEDPRSYVIETIWPSDFVSPTMSGGERRVRLFGYEWKQFCAMNVHGALLP